MRYRRNVFPTWLNSWFSRHLDSSVPPLWGGTAIWGLDSDACQRGGSLDIEERGSQLVNRYRPPQSTLGATWKVPVGKSGSERWTRKAAGNFMEREGYLDVRISQQPKRLWSEIMWLCTKRGDPPGSCRTWRPQETRRGPGPDDVGLK